MQRRGFGRTWLTAIVAAILILTVTGPGQAKNGQPGETGTLGLWPMSSWDACPEAVSFFDVGTPTGNDIYTGNVTLGMFGRGGRVEGGDYALAMAVDLGTLPASRIDFPNVIDSDTGSAGMYVTPSRPKAMGIVDVGAGTDWLSLGWAPMEGSMTTQAAGQGTAVVRLAMLTREGRSWRKVQGITLNKTVTIVNPSPSGNCMTGGTNNPNGFTMGGAYVSP
jgi:hypothetical protein